MACFGLTAMSPRFAAYARALGGTNLLSLTMDGSMPYKVHVVDIGCCQSEIDPKEVEAIANKMESEGLQLVQTYIDSTVACCGNKKSVIMIFRR